MSREKLKIIGTNLNKLAHTVGRLKEQEQLEIIDKHLLLRQIQELYEQALLLDEREPKPEPHDPAHSPEELLMENQGQAPQQAKSEPSVEAELEERKQQPSEEKDDLNRHFRQQSKDLADRLKSYKVADIRSAIGINDRFTFINELFNGNAGAFDQAIRKINETSGPGQANALIDELQQQFSWEKNHQVVKDFRAIVHKRFS